MIDSLYYFNKGSSEDGMAQGLSGTSSPTIRGQIMLWHLRLGHPSFQYLKHLFPTLFKNVDCSSFQCESCILAKSHRISYTPKPYRASKPFYLIHSNVWDPSKITTQFGKRWFVSFMDDHTQLCWVYIMHDKSDVATLFETFYNMIENQFNTKIGKLHNDKGT